MPPAKRFRSPTSCANRDHSQPRNVRILAAYIARCPPKCERWRKKNYRLWSANAFHPSLHFKSIGKSDWSVRVGGHYRAVGKFSGETFLWEWIGSHEEYNKRF